MTPGSKKKEAMKALDGLMDLMLEAILEESKDEVSRSSARIMLASNRIVSVIHKVQRYADPMAQDVSVENRISAAVCLESVLEDINHFLESVPGPETTSFDHLIK